MFLEFKKGELNKFVKQAINKAGTIRNLSREINIPKSTLFNNYTEKKRINEKNLKKIEFYLGIKIDKRIINNFPINWKQIKGGRNCAAKKNRFGILNNQLANARNKISPGKSAKEWHKKMKREDPEKYYKSQYEKFKKIGGYKFITNKGEKVRNKLELDTANKLNQMGIEYEYEPFILINKKAFFPDFLLKNNTIIECTMWRGYDKAIKLKEKIKHLKKKYRVFVLIPKALNNYYKILNNYLITELSINDLIAQPVEHLTVNQRVGGSSPPEVVV